MEDLVGDQRSGPPWTTASHSVLQPSIGRAELKFSSEN